MYFLSGLLVKQEYVEFILAYTIVFCTTGCLHALSQNQSELHENFVQSSNHLNCALHPLFTDDSIALTYSKNKKKNHLIKFPSSLNIITYRIILRSS